VIVAVESMRARVSLSCLKYATLPAIAYRPAFAPDCVNAKRKIASSALRFTPERLPEKRSTSCSTIACVVLFRNDR
jgi:hypothetical protein